MKHLQNINSLNTQNTMAKPSILISTITPATVNYWNNSFKQEHRGDRFRT